VAGFLHLVRLDHGLADLQIRLRESFEVLYALLVESFDPQSISVSVLWRNGLSGSIAPGVTRIAGTKHAPRFLSLHAGGSQGVFPQKSIE
jgi:hypothetical protein